MRSTGTALIEAVAAVTIASALAAAGALGARDILAVLEQVRARERALTAARNLVEAARTAPCGRARAVAPCPSELTCTLRREILLQPTDRRLALVRIDATVTANAPGAAVTNADLTLSTATRPPRSCR